GGQSRRMQTDKGLLVYHNKPQREYLYDLLSEFCEKVYMSVRYDQVDELHSKVEYIVDQNKYPGPFNGIMSAYLKDAQSAWLVIACDMPMVDRESIARLILKRNLTQKATVYKAKDKEYLEPLFAIWEPKALAKVEECLNKDKVCSSPLKFLRDNDVEVVNPSHDDVLL